MLLYERVFVFLRSSIVYPLTPFNILTICLSTRYVTIFHMRSVLSLFEMRELLQIFSIHAISNKDP